MASAAPHPANLRRTALWAAGAALFMLGLGFASVPLYRLFCQVTGFSGTTQRITAEEAAKVKVAATTISVRFDGNVDRNLPWQFGPEQITQTIHLGARSLAVYNAKNLTDRPITGRASFNVSPDAAGRYFTKIECFCFTQQTLQPGQEVRMPVIYYVDPEILKDEDGKDIRQITLSYTFHEDRSGNGTEKPKGLDRGRTAG
jgi:cytochrome c oxidase assembly protein subunit 11